MPICRKLHVYLMNDSNPIFVLTGRCCSAYASLPEERDSVIFVDPKVVLYSLTSYPFEGLWNYDSIVIIIAILKSKHQPYAVWYGVETWKILFLVVVDQQNFNCGLDKLLNGWPQRNTRCSWFLKTEFETVTTGSQGWF